MKNNRGSILIVTMIVLYSILTLAYVGIGRSLSNLKATYTSVTLSEAFHVADGGVDEAIAKLEDPTLGLWTSCDTGYSSPLGGEYTIKCPDSNLRKITSFGDRNTTDNRSVTRVIEVYGERTPPKGFYENAVYAANGLDFKGGAYLVVGDVLTGYTDSISNLDHVTGGVVQDESAAPLPEVDHEMLKTIAISQGNYFDDWTVQFRQFPKKFWYNSSTGMPNVVYVDASLLTLGTRVKNVGGFIIVNGDVEVNGNATVDGVIYTTGNFTVNGGGHTLNVAGGILTANIAELNGDGLLEHSQEYMDAILDLTTTTTFSVLIWRELRGDPKTWYDQRGNRCHSSEQYCAINVSGWDMIAYGVTSESDRSVTYRNPDNEREVVQVFYDPTLDGNQVTSIDSRTYSAIDGSVVVKDASNVYQAASTYTEAGGL